MHIIVCMYVAMYICMYSNMYKEFKIQDGKNVIHTFSFTIQVGMHLLYWNNFGNNQMEKELRIILEL